VISVVIPVFRDAMRAFDLIHSLLLQELPPDHPLEIVVVDDGSNDGSTELLRQCETEQVHVVTLPLNMGRSAARNAGAELARGEFLAFVDCDCRPEGSRFLAAHLQLLRNDCVAACGPVSGDGNGFWSHYQSEASHRRARQHAQGASFVGSTQNFTVRNEAFHRIGGFDDRYSGYGFEDRDLFVRLSQLGTFGWCADAAVTHLDKLTLPSVLKKMQQAAGDSAGLFMLDHANAYSELGYAALDTRLHPWLRSIGWIRPSSWRTLSWLDKLITSHWMPYRPAMWFVKLLVALTYISGSTNPSGKANPRDYRNQSRSS
jgi:glycosyltransferase involved in cell wall biosynthesis